MILLLLFLLSLFVWLGARLFEVRNHWTDIVSQITIPIGGELEKFIIPGIGLVIFVAVGIGILYVTNLLLQSIYAALVSQIHLKDQTQKLPIQLVGASVHTDAMNENIEPVVAWLPLRLAKWVIGFFVYKLILALIIFVLAVVIPIIANALGAAETGRMIAEILKEVCFTILRYAMNVNGMVIFGYSILVVYAYSLYKIERIFIRDYAIMQKQIANR